jgi:hypothetical protein
VVRWRDGDAVPTERPVKVVLQMNNTRLYSLASTGAEPR